MLPSYPILETQRWRGGRRGSGDAGLDERAEKETVFPARSLGEDAAVLRSEHPFSDWLLEGAADVTGPGDAFGGFRKPSDFHSFEVRLRFLSACGRKRFVGGVSRNGRVDNTSLRRF